MNPIELTVFANRIEAICDEMGAVLCRSAFSPNIKDRLDYSCAVFDQDGALCAQAAHIPVHLGSMAYAMADVVERFAWQPGDCAIFNDPFLGGTHLPDVTLVAPVFVDEQLVAFCANRAHHADIGGDTPGSMPLSRTLDEEGVVIAPRLLVSAGVLDEGVLNEVAAATGNPMETRGDFSAQLSAAQTGVQRLTGLIDAMGRMAFTKGLAALNDYAERLARTALGQLPQGQVHYTDWLDDDGAGNRDLPISVIIDVDAGGQLHVDFTGTAAQVAGNVNCPLSVTAAAVYYALRCLMPAQTPSCAGTLRPVAISAPEGSLVHAGRPAAVALGNVETSSRIVDAVLGALAQILPEAIPAASQGSMNNLAMGARGPEGNWDYYETMGGGMGAGPHGGGLSAVQTHMTNTLNTPVEALEMRYPLRVRRYAIRRGSGGAGQRSGGDGLVREYEFLQPTQVTLGCERRTRAPWGLNGGAPGAPGVNRRGETLLAPKVCCDMASGERLVIETPGGGGWGTPEA